MADCDTSSALTIVVLGGVESTRQEGFIVRVSDAVDRQSLLAEGKSDGSGELRIESLKGWPDEVVIEVIDQAGTLVATSSPVPQAATGVHVQITLPPGAQADGRRLTLLGGQLVDRAAAALLSNEELLQALRTAHGRPAKLERADLVVRAFPWLDGPVPGDCGTLRGEAILELLAERDLDRKAIEREFDFETGEVVKSFYTTRIQVKYTTTPGSTNRVDPTTPSGDSPFAIPGGPTVGMLRSTLAGLDPANTEVAPTYVQKVGLIAEYALDRYLGSAFNVRDPRNGATRLEYRVLTQATGVLGRTWPTWNWVETAPDLSDMLLMGTIPHEMFHQIQYRYNSSTSSTGNFRSSFLEGGARLAEDCICDAPNRYVRSGGTDWLANPGLSFKVDTAYGAVYGAGLLWKYVAEQHSTRTTAGDEPAVGFDSYRRLLESTATALTTDPGRGYTSDALRAGRAAMPWHGTFDRFTYNDSAHSERTSEETTWANFLVASYLHGLGTPVGDRRFDYMEDDESFASGTGTDRLTAHQAAVGAADDIVMGQGGSRTFSAVGAKPWSARYFRLRPSPSSPPRMLRIAFSAAATAGLTDPIVQIVRLGAGAPLIDISRSDGTSYTKTINMDGLSEVVVIVALRDSYGDYTLTFTELPSASDVMVTRWNSIAGREYEIDPRGYSWTWISPDVMVDNDGDGTADPHVFFDHDNVLKLRLRNRGNAPASGITVDFWYQKATPGLSATGWIPMTDSAGNPSRVTGAALGAAGSPSAEQWFSVNWSPHDDGTHSPHWCIKAHVTAPGDPNADNKQVFSNFGSLIVGSPDRTLLLRTLPDHSMEQTFVIARGPRWSLRPIGGPQTPRPQQPLRLAAPVDAARSAVRFAQLSLRETKKLRCWDGREATVQPHSGTYYPADPASLPPGVDPQKLVTVAHVVDGHVLGGVTYQVDEQKEGDWRTTP